MNQLVLFLGLMLGCDSQQPAKSKEPQQTTATETVTETATETVTETATEPQVEPMDEPSLSSQLQGDAEVLPTKRRDFRRVDIDQLNALIEQATGRKWLASNGSDDQFEELALTLGRPDYFEKVVEDLSPSLLFHKFLEDAANSVCSQLILEEVNAAAEDRIFLRHVVVDDTDPVLIKENLRYLLLRFHGRRYGSDAAVLDNWLALFTESAQMSEQKPGATWMAICVALIRHPDFYSY